MSDLFYHGTSHKAAEHIAAHGVDPSKSKYGSKIFLTKLHHEAQKYSKIANNGKLGKVFSVERKHLDPKHIAKEHSGIIEYTGAIHKDHIVGT